MLLKIEPLRNELNSLESEASVSEAKVRPCTLHLHTLNHFHVLYLTVILQCLHAVILGW